MSFRAFLSSRVRLIAPVLICDAFVCLMIGVLGCTASAVLLTAAVLLTGLFAGLGLEYARNKKYYAELGQLAQQLEHPYQMTSLMKEPVVVDQQLVFDALQTMGHAAATEVAEAEATAKESREYMEAWVHEVKTPLAAALLIAERTPEPEAGQLKGELDRSLRQVDQVLWYARSQSVEADYRIRRVPLVQLAREACKQNARFLIERGVTPSLEIDPDLQVFTDEKQATFIVSQAVVNATKYGATRIAFTAQETTDEVGAHQVELRIADDGWGVPAADVPRVFERGFTGTRGRQAGSSTGMGLYLAATLCQKLGLGLSLSSEEGQGTEVKVTFPFDNRRV